MIKGVGYNPFPQSPDPWAVAIAKGLIRSEHDWLGRWANRTERWPDATGQWEPGDNDVADAYMARYGRRIIDPAPAGAELVGNIWDQVLTTLYQLDSEESLRGIFQREWRRADFDGVVTPRELTDASFANPRGFICRAFALDNREGYTPQNPIRIDRPEIPERGAFIVPGRVTRGEPAHFAALRLSPWGCALYYVNEATGTVPEPPVPPEPPPEPPVEHPKPEDPECRLLLAKAALELAEVRAALEARSTENDRLAADLREALANLRDCQVERDRLGLEVDALGRLVARLREVFPVVVPLDIQETMEMAGRWNGPVWFGAGLKARLGRLRRFVDGLKGRTA